MVGIKAHKSSITTHKLDPEEKIANLLRQIAGLERLISTQTEAIQLKDEVIKGQDATISKYEKMIDDHVEAMKK